MRKPLLILLTITLLPALASAQKLYERKIPDPFPTDGHKAMWGWHIAPGITYTATKSGTQETTLGPAETLVDKKDKSRIGFYFEGGLFHIFPKGAWLTYMDYSLAWKWLRGADEFEGVNSAVAGESSFSDHFLLGNFNLNKVTPIKEDIFIQNSLGVNLDWRFINGYEVSGNTYDPQEPGNLVGQLHYKFGVGFKINENMMIIPSIETPILNAYQWDSFKSTLPYGHSRFRPLILSVRFLILHDSNGLNCPPVYANPEDQMKDDMFQNGDQ